MSYSDVLARVCRVCLRHVAPPSRMESLYTSGPPVSLNDLARAVLTFAHISISVDDQMPQQICFKCLHLLKQAITFKLTCERSHRHLQRVMRTESRVDGAGVQADMVQYSMFANYFPEYIASGCKDIEDDLDDSVDENDQNDMDHLNKVDFTDENDRGNTADDFDYDDISNDATSRVGGSEISSDLSPEEVWFFKKVSKSLRADKKALKLSRLVATSDRSRTSGTIRKFNEMVARRKRLNGCEAARLQEALLSTRFPEPERAAESLACARCGKTYSSRSSLRTHMHRHTGFKFICEHCGKGFATKNEMDVHSMALHGLEKHFACHLCHFKAKRRAELTEHVRTHTGERPYACETCGLTFRRKPILRKHLVHHQEKQFKCTECPKMFYHRNHLAAHANNVHRRRYLYRCTVPACPATYAKSASVRKHLRELHGVPREQQGRPPRVPAPAAPPSPRPDRRATDVVHSSG